MIPTSTSIRPLSLRLPVHESTTIGECLAQLHRELGLPISTRDLVGPGSRSKGSTSSGADTAIQWAVRLGSLDGERVALDKRIMDIATRGLAMHISIDEGWLYEMTPSHSRSPSMARQNDTSEVHYQDEEEEKEDTLKAASPKRRTAILADKVTSPQKPGQARLSNLFHAWVDTNQHPAPPSTPQRTLVGGEATDVLAAVLHEGMEDRLALSPEREHVSASTPIGSSERHVVSRFTQT